MIHASTLPRDSRWEEYSAASNLDANDWSCAAPEPRKKAPFFGSNIGDNHRVSKESTVRNNMYNQGIEWQILTINLCLFDIFPRKKTWTIWWFELIWWFWWQAQAAGTRIPPPLGPRANNPLAICVRNRRAVWPGRAGWAGCSLVKCRAMALQNKSGSPLKPATHVTLWDNFERGRFQVSLWQLRMPQKTYKKDSLE